ncbi:unnamed protein product [Prunus armeniaca]
MSYVHRALKHMLGSLIQLICHLLEFLPGSYLLLEPLCRTGKSRKRARMAKKAALAKKPEKAVEVSTVMDTKNRLSSKIKYDALDRLNEELGCAPAFEEGIKSNCDSHGDMQLSNEKNSRDDEFEHESNGYSEEAEARQGQDDVKQLNLVVFDNFFELVSV